MQKFYRLFFLACLAWVKGALALELHLFNWTGYLGEKTKAKFEERCRCRIVEDTYASNDELLAKLASGVKGYDLIVPTGHAVEILIHEQKLLPLDKKKLPHLSNIEPAFLHPPYDPENRYSVPYATTTTILGYRKEKIQELGLAANSWTLIFDPRLLEKIKGKVMVLDEAREVLGAALMSLGHPANDTDPEHLKEAQALIQKAKPFWAAFSNQSYMREIVSGGIWVAMGYSSDFFQAARNARAVAGPEIAYGIPKEGAVLAVDNLAIPVGAREPELAHAFIDFVLEGEAGQELAESLGMGIPNKETKAKLSQEILANEAIFPPSEALLRLHQLRAHPLKTRRLIDRIWSEIKAY